MPWINRLTRSGTALHAGSVPGYPASHGCIRLPLAFAPKLFDHQVGDNVVVAGNQTAPKLIEHPNLSSLSLRTWPSPLVHRLGVMQMAMRREPGAFAIWSRTAPSAIASSPCSTSFCRWAFSRRRTFPEDLGQRRRSIKAFQKANGLPETGRFTDQLAKKVYEVARTEEPAEGAFRETRLQALI